MKCLICKKSEKQKHRNSKYCLPCALNRRSQPKSTMTKAQIAKVKKLIGKMSREDIAAKLGVSISNLKRAFRGTRLAFYNYCVANPSLVKNVGKYYETHTQGETAKYFRLSQKQIDHIVYRYKSHRPKQIRWSDNQIVEAARMAGLVSYKGQAKYFNRPNAFEGSIKSLWCKRFNMGNASIHGLPHWVAKELVNKNARYLRPIGNDRHGNQVQFIRIIPWCEMEKCLKKDVPDFIKEAIKTMAQFQRWLFNSQNPKREILKIISEREST